MVEILWRVWQAEMPDADLPVVQSCIAGQGWAVVAVLVVY